MYHEHQAGLKVAVFVPNFFEFGLGKGHTLLCASGVEMRLVGPHMPDATIPFTFMTTHRILLIEDDPTIGQSLLDGFRTHGFEPHLCTTGGSGADFAKRHSPHLILLDIRLPDGSGFDFCRQIRQAGIKQPIIMLTAQHDELDKVLGFEMDARTRLHRFTHEHGNICCSLTIRYQFTGNLSQPYCRPISTPYPSYTDSTSHD